VASNPLPVAAARAGAADSAGAPTAATVVIGSASTSQRRDRCCDVRG
jgi:hypothetical protein